MIDNYLELLSNTPLFHDISRDDVKDLLDCMNSHIEEFPKESFIFLAGNEPSGIGIMLEGRANIIKEDIFGNRSIIGNVEKGDIFGEVFACAQIHELPVSVETETYSKVLIMDYKKIITTCSSNCRFHNMLIKNMLQILAHKNLYLNNKNDILASRTTRDKIMKFLETVAGQKDSLSFDIPYNRQELADFLAINRSAMTKELIKMQEEGIVSFNKNHFELL